MRVMQPGQGDAVSLISFLILWKRKDQILCLIPLETGSNYAWNRDPTGEKTST